MRKMPALIEHPVDTIPVEIASTIAEWLLPVFRPSESPPLWFGAFGLVVCL